MTDDLKSIDEASDLVEAGLSLDGLDAIYDSQRLIGTVIGQKVLLEIAVNATDVKERRLAAQALVKAVDEDPEKVADRIRASAFKDLDVETLEAMVNTGTLDPEEARAQVD